MRLIKAGMADLKVRPTGKLNAGRRRRVHLDAPRQRRNSVHTGTRTITIRHLTRQLCHLKRLLPGVMVLCANFLASATLLADEAGETAAPGVDTAALVRVVIGLLVVLLLIVALGWVMRRVGRYSSPAAGQLRVIGGVSVGTRERVVLVQVGEQQLLVGVAPGRVQTLHVLDKPLDGASGTGDRHGGPAEQGHPFAQRLRQMMQPDEKRQQ
ncbi:flagellar biosynthetic protein FliO [Aquisalimonas sp. 2447]|uniref:flagellar biosynthetic protein FliO n=1 Tax=Aquisalimonas sp. 2447 TaxID=2740807 RepID=UPI0020C354CF|nr:flagellar biosynthetic protein FliO [Aquisalimonas sp. 2447]